MSWFGFAPYPTLRKAIVTRKNASDIRGIIWQRKAGYLVVRNAEVLVSPSEATSMDGEVLIPESEIELIQLLAG